MKRFLVILSFALCALLTSCEKDISRLISNDLVGEWQLDTVRYYQIIDGASVEVEPDRISSIQMYPRHHIMVTHANIAYVIKGVRVYHSNYSLIRGVIYADALSDYSILEFEDESMVLKIQDPPWSSKYYVLYYDRISDHVY